MPRRVVKASDIGPPRRRDASVTVSMGGAGSRGHQRWHCRAFRSPLRGAEMVDISRDRTYTGRNPGSGAHCPSAAGTRPRPVRRDASNSRTAGERRKMSCQRQVVARRAAGLGAHARGWDAEPTWRADGRGHSLKALRRKLKGERSYRVGGASWYMASSAGGRLIRLTASPRSARRLLGAWRL